MKTFDREDRYVVIKKKHLSDQTMDLLYNALDNLGLKTTECVVVEKDWLEYAPVWSMIEDRVTGKARAAIDSRGEGVAAWCCSSDPFNSTAFAWPGTDRKDCHDVPLYLHPPRPADAGKEVEAELWLLIKTVMQQALCISENTVAYAYEERIAKLDSAASDRVSQFVALLTPPANLTPQLIPGVNDALAGLTIRAKG